MAAASPAGKALSARGAEAALHEGHGARDRVGISDQVLQVGEQRAFIMIEVID
jgi:hypothetical protein